MCEKDSATGGETGHRPGRGHCRATRIRLVAALALGLPLSLACSSDDPPISEGRALFEATCMECHGEEARGGGALAASLPVEPPSILEHLAHHTNAQLIGLVRGGVPPAMPPQPLTEDEVRLVIDYVWTLVPESEVAALRAMQQQMEMIGDTARPSMPGMDHSSMPGMDHSSMPGMGQQGGAMPGREPDGP